MDFFPIDETNTAISYVECGKVEYTRGGDIVWAQGGEHSGGWAGLPARSVVEEGGKSRPEVGQIIIGHQPPTKAIGSLEDAYVLLSPHSHPKEKRALLFETGVAVCPQRAKRLGRGAAC